jgi:hypothetical protein
VFEKLLSCQPITTKRAFIVKRKWMPVFLRPGMFFNLKEQPFDQRLMLRLAALAHEVLAKVPVCGVKDAHGFGLQLSV